MLLPFLDPLLLPFLDPLLFPFLDPLLLPFLDPLLLPFLDPFTATDPDAVFDGEAFDAGDVLHVFLRFDLVNGLLDSTTEGLGKAHDPIDEAKKVDDLFFLEPFFVEAANELDLRAISRFGIRAGALGLEVGHGDHGKGIRTRFQLFPSPIVMQELDGRKFEAAAASRQVTGDERLGMKATTLVTENRQRHHRTTVQVIDPVIVDEHPLGKTRFRLRLDFDMDQDLERITGIRPNPEQLVRPSAADFRFRVDLL